MLAQGNAVDAADRIRQDTGPSCCAVVCQGVTEVKLRIAFDGLLHGSPRNGAVLLYGTSIRAKSRFETQIFAFPQEDKAAFRAGELHGKLEERMKDFRDGASGIQLASGIEKEAELLHLARRLW